MYIYIFIYICNFILNDINVVLIILEVLIIYKNYNKLVPYIYKYRSNMYIQYVLYRCRVIWKYNNLSVY